MILEHAVLQVRPGQEQAFEAAIAKAWPLIAASSGFLGMRVYPAVEASGQYLLFAEWQDIASHRDGFRKSERYAEWRELLHGFYDPMPEVIYYAEPLCLT
jgi:heme-degrading monooxygenase HmoA